MSVLNAFEQSSQKDNAYDDNNVYNPIVSDNIGLVNHSYRSQSQFNSLPNGHQSIKQIPGLNEQVAAAYENDESKDLEELDESDHFDMGRSPPKKMDSMTPLYVSDQSFDENLSQSSKKSPRASLSRNQRNAYQDIFL